MSCETSAGAGVDRQPPIDFIVSVWGAPFVDLLLRLCLASMMAPGNLPRLAGARHRLTIYTTSADAESIRQAPIFKAVARQINVDILPLAQSVPGFVRAPVAEKIRRDGGTPPKCEEEWQTLRIGPDALIEATAWQTLCDIAEEIGTPLNEHFLYALKIHFMGAGHAAGLKLAYERDSFAAILMPDMVFADGAIGRMAELVQDGYDIVMTAACRFNEREVMDRLEAAGEIIPGGEPLALPPRRLVSILLSEPHPLTESFDLMWECFNDVGTTALLKSADGTSAVLANFFWAPILVRIARAETIDWAYFDHGGTTDGRFIAQNFPDRRRIYAVRSSDELFLASVTPREDYRYPVRSDAFKRNRWFGPVWKAYLVRRTMFGPMGDPIKRSCYREPVDFIGDPAPEPETLRALRAEVRRFARRALRRFRPRDAVLDGLFAMQRARRETSADRCGQILAFLRGTARGLVRPFTT